MKLCVSLFEDMGCTLIYISFISVHDTQKTSVINSLYPDSRQNPINQSIMSMEQRRGRGEILSVNCALKSMQIQCGFGTCFDFIPVNLCSKFCLRLETIRGRRIATNGHFPIAIGKFIIVFFERVFKICVESTKNNLEMGKKSPQKLDKAQNSASQQCKFFKVHV